MDQGMRMKTRTLKLDEVWCYGDAPDFRKEILTTRVAKNVARLPSRLKRLA